MAKEHTPYQRRVIENYYKNQGAILHQRLANLVGELYLAEGKRAERLWQSARQALEKLGLPRERVEHLSKRRDPALLAELVKELEEK